MALTPDGLVVRSPRCEDTGNYGLLSVVEPVTNVDPHWMSSGMEWEDFLCSPGVTGFIDECPPATGFTKPIDRTTQFCRAEPFVLVGSYQCPPVGRPADEAFEIARQRLLKWEEWQLEKTLWTGVVANGTGFVNPSFAFGNDECDIDAVDVNTAGAVNSVEAISLLEESLANDVGCGIIHVPAAYAAYLQNADLIEKENGIYYSPLGFRYVIGRGYPGSGPSNAAAAAGTTWLFGTGPLVLAKSDLFQYPNNVAEGLNRSINDIEVRAERFYAVGFSCALFAVRANHTVV